MAGKSTVQQAYDNGMIVGMAIACSTIQDAFDQPRMCAEVLNAAALNRRKMKRAGVDEYDLKILKPVFAELKR